MSSQLIVFIVVLVFLSPLGLGLFYARQSLKNPDYDKILNNKWKIIISFAPYSYLGHYKYRWTGKHRIIANNELATHAEKLGLTVKGLKIRMQIIDILLLSSISVLFCFITPTFIKFLISIVFWYFLSALIIGLTVRSTRTQPLRSSRPQ